MMITLQSLVEYHNNMRDFKNSKPSLKQAVSGTYRFVICIDINSTSLNEAYSKLYDSMKKISSPQLEWESTDEAYFPDGEEVDPTILQKSREYKLDQNNH